MAMAATPSRPGDHETEFTRPGVSEDEIEEIKKVFTMMDTQNGKRPARGQLDPNQLMEAMNALGIVWKKSDVYQTLAEVDHDNSGTVGLERARLRTVNPERLRQIMASASVSVAVRAAAEVSSSVTRKYAASDLAPRLIA